MSEKKHQITQQVVIDPNYPYNPSRATTRMAFFKEDGTPFVIEETAEIELPATAPAIPGYWHPPACIKNGPSGESWPTINRLYWTPLRFQPGTLVSAIAFRQENAGAGTATLRLAALNNNDVNMPGSVFQQASFPAAAGVVQLDFSFPFEVGPSGLLHVISGPQGSGAVGSAWMGTASFGTSPTSSADATWNWGAYNPTPWFYTGSGAVPDNPSLSPDGNESYRFPFVAARVNP